MGILRAGSAQELRSAVHVDTGTSVGSWLDTGLIRVIPLDSNDVETNVPVGTYRVNAGLATERDHIVSAGSAAHLRD